MSRHLNTHKERGRTKYFLTEKQQANLILAARGICDCPAANREVRKLDKKFNLKKRK